MHIPWGWVKQRPHFIAQYLSKYYDVTLLYKQSFIKNGLVQESIPDNLKEKRLFIIPNRFAGYGLIRAVNSAITKIQLKGEIEKYDIIWFTHPLMFDLIEAAIPEDAKVIYDCMDDVLEFPLTRADMRMKNVIANCEMKLVERSDIIFISSDYLETKIRKRYSIDSQRVFVFNNAMTLEDRVEVSNNLLLNIIERSKVARFKLAYVGTISEWFDFDLILESLERFNNIVYMLFGPLDTEIPNHERILYFGPIEHKYVLNVMELSDALIMPFKLSELILSVNPVKIYEYIYSCKPSIVIQYPETSKFEDYVFLYKSRDEYFNLLEKLENGNLVLKGDCLSYKEFAINNGWQNRVKDMVKIIGDICGR